MTSTPTRDADARASVIQELVNPAETRLLIDGRWRDADEGGTTAVIDPANEEEFAQIADAQVSDGRAALDAAVAAQEAWALTPPRDRAELLRAAWELTINRREALATLMSAEMGKPLAESLGEVNYGAEFLRWFSEEAVRINGRTQRSPEGTLQIGVRKRPVGPCLFITPWNFPLAMATRKVAPAIAAGCTVVLKPSEVTPLTALAFGQIMQDVGLPPGVLNIVPTSNSPGLSAALIADARLRKLSFTGSTQVGKALLAQASTNVLRCSMELGGSAPFIVFDDADVDVAIDAAIHAKMRNMGEACTAANRFYVHESIEERFTRGLVERFSALRLGHGLDSNTDVGPMISRAHQDKIDRLVKQALNEGGSLACGGRPLDGPGFFYEPTVISNVSTNSTIMKEETFGPVAAIATFSAEDDVVTMANDVDVGLAGYIFTRDNARVQRLASRLEVGMIGVNTGLLSNAAAPFGGVKHSGLGREGGLEGIEEFLETVYIATPYA